MQIPWKAVTRTKEPQPITPYAGIGAIIRQEIPVTFGPVVHQQIRYIIPFAGEVRGTWIQGFSAGLLGVSFIARHVVRLPASVEELCMSKLELRARRAAGLSFYHVFFTPIELLPTIDVSTPFAVVFSDAATLSSVQEWLAALSGVRPLHVSSQVAPGALELRRLTRARLRYHIRGILLELVRNPEWTEEANKLLRNMRPFLRRRPVSFPQRWHNTVVPNELALYSVGMQFLRNEQFIPSPDDSEVITAIARSAQKILSLRAHVQPVSLGYAPGLIITTTGQSPEVIKDILEAKAKKWGSAAKHQLGLRLLQQQKGYFHALDSSVLEEFLTDQDFSAPIMLRAREHNTQTDALAIRAASELAAVIRLPPRIRHCRDRVIRFADCYRGGSARRSAKLFKTYRDLIQDMRQCVSDQLYDVIRSTSDGLRVVSDLPLEWLPSAHGLPLLFERECSRIPTTPGTLMFLQLMPRPPLVITADSLREILVVRSYASGDKLAPILEYAASYFLNGVDNLRLHFVDCKRGKDLYDALNSFRGSIVIFDGHGEQIDRQTFLWVGDDRVSGNELAASTTVPPIVILSACDTHATDAGHATIANGFLSAGARTVLASMMQLDGVSAAIFAGRVLRAISELLPLLLQSQRGFVRWSTLLSRVLRGQLLHECVMPYARDKVTAEQYQTHMTPCIALIAAEHPEWFPRALSHISNLVGKSLKKYPDLLSLANSFPDAALYVQLGDPSSILIGGEAPTATNAPG